MSVQPVQLELDSSVRRRLNGTALLGGSTFRLIRLSAGGARLLDCWLAGDSTPASEEADELRDRLVASGIVHPVPAVDAALPSIGFVVPVYDDPEGLRVVLRALRAEFASTPIIVVDDASPDPQSLALVAAEFNAELLRHDTNTGPGASRNTGWRRLAARFQTRADVVVFVDADVVPTSGSMRRLLGHFADEAVAAAAPRVRAKPGMSRLDAYEATNSPLDLGEAPAIVAPGTRISYVPSAVLAVRSAALEQHDGFSERIRFGEDVDLVWRMCDVGQIIRYEPKAVVHHRNRASLAALARQRWGYGSSAAVLANDHRAKVAPLQLPPATIAATVAVLLGTAPLRAVAAMTAVARALPLASQLTGMVDHPRREAARLMAMSHVYAAQGLASAITRTWLPLLGMSKRGRRLALVAMIVPGLIDWLRKRPRNDPATHVGLRVIDDGAYCAGVWTGVASERSPAALLPSRGDG